MIITKENLTDDHYRATYVMLGRVCSGFGSTALLAIKNCLHDMKIVAELDYETVMSWSL